jgi:hypothetical protein
VNALRYNWSSERRDDTYLKVVWHETVLDIAVKEKKTRWDELSRNSQFTLPQIEERRGKIDAVGSMLEKAGRTRKSDEKHP